MTWGWALRHDHEGTFWDIVEDNHRLVGGAYIYDTDDNDSVEYIAHEFIRVAKRHSPIQTRLYRLVYGSLP